MLQKEKIIAQSLELFLRHGLRSIRMDDIASTLSVSKRTLYEIFGNRENLVCECIHFLSTQQQEKRYSTDREQENKNVVEIFLELIEEWDAIIARNITLMMDVQKFYPKLHETHTQQHRAKSIEHIKTALLEGIKQGVILEGINVDFAAQMIIGFVHHLLISPVVLEQTGISANNALKYTMLFFIRSVSTQRGLALIDRVIEEKKLIDNPLDSKEK